MINKPYKVIHQYKNDYQRTVYILYIFLGSLVSDDIKNILEKIKKLNLTNTLEKLTKKKTLLLEKTDGDYWYENFFLSDHIIR